jgi:hypothetical protein
MKSQASASSRPAPSAQPLTAGDQRHPHALQHVAHVVAVFGEAARLLRIHPRHRLDVGAGGERAVARAGQDRAADAGVAFDRAQRRHHRVDGLPSRGVARLGPVDGERDDRAVARGEDAGSRAALSVVLVIVSCWSQRHVRESGLALRSACSRCRKNRTRAHSCARASRPRRIAQQWAGAYFGSPRSRCRTSRIASVVSSPIRSMSANGPIG